MYVTPTGGVTTEFAELMVKLAGAWSAKLDEVRVRVYARALCDVPIESLRRACGLAVRELKYFPSVAELRAFVVPTGDDAGLIAWTALGQAASSVGAYASVVVEDGAAAEALEAVFGTWAQFCETEEGPALGARRQEFLAAYRAARRRPHGPARLAGLLAPAPDGAAAHTWVARIVGGSVTTERDGPRQIGEGTHAALPETGTET